MISLDDFINITNSAVYPSGNGALNQQQEDAVRHTPDRVLQIVAGPGSGKTAVLILRGLRLVFVNGILPEHILVVTFTKKAARELRSRWLRHGEAIKRAVGSDGHIDLNHCQIGTLDSIAQQALTDHRLPGETAPITMDGTAGRLALRRFAFSSHYPQNQTAIDELLAKYTFDGRKPKNRGDALSITQTVLQRLIQDRVNISSYQGSGKSESAIADILQAYQENCKSRNAYDFAGMENLFLKRVAQGHLNPWTDGVKALLIDEYQDTNPLQEAIYFRIIRATSAITTVVGDDDQSIYRFRGGSVELFAEFANRCQKETGHPVDRVDISENYRSTPDIADFYNKHIAGDPKFRQARINPPKPPVHATRNPNGIPVLGMFRPDEDSLAESLSKLLAELVQQRRYQIGQQIIELPPGGDLGDMVFLSHSVNERRYDWRKDTTTEHFPLILRRKLEKAGLEVFNARGQSLRDVADVQKILGLILLAVDPGSKVTGTMRLREEAKYYLNVWRKSAESLIATHPQPNDNGGLEGFIKKWQDAALGQHMDSKTWQEWLTIDVIYRLLAWLPAFLNEPEHQAWLQAILGSIDNAIPISAYGMKLHSNTEGSPATHHVLLSREVFIRDALVPIAEDDVDINEDILPSIPRNRLQMMTIHQAKGLEFPMVIVDVGSRFRQNSPAQKFLRFPQKPSNVVKQEDDMESHLPAPLRSNRSAIDRTFDDLVRLYYVAYSRPQSILLLVGHENCLRVKRPIHNVATGWRRDENWTWNATTTSRRQPIRANTLPFRLIHENMGNHEAQPTLF